MLERLEIRQDSAKGSFTGPYMRYVYVYYVADEHLDPEDPETTERDFRAAMQTVANVLGEALSAHRFADIQFFSDNGGLHYTFKQNMCLGHRPQKDFDAWVDQRVAAIQQALPGLRIQVSRIVKGHPRVLEYAGEGSYRLVR